MHLTQDPHVETTHKTRYQKKPSSGAALCGVVTGPLGGLRRDVRRSPDSQDAHAVGLNHRRIRRETAKHVRVNPHSKVRQAWIVSGATQNFDTYVYLTHHQSTSVFVGGGVGRPETRLIYTVPTQITDRNELGV